MNISETFIRRPIATSLMMLGLLVFGAATYSLLPVAALPNVDFPTITVSATLPGASPETMASSVATPLEQQFAAIPGLASMNSTSGLGTTSTKGMSSGGLSGCTTSVRCAEVIRPYVPYEQYPDHRNGVHYFYWGRSR